MGQCRQSAPSGNLFQTLIHAYLPLGQGKEKSKCYIRALRSDSQ